MMIYNNNNLLSLAEILHFLSQLSISSTISAHSYPETPVLSSYQLSQGLRLRGTGSQTGNSYPTFLIPRNLREEKDETLLVVMKTWTMFQKQKLSSQMSK